MIERIKSSLLRLTEPWREEAASLDLEWRVFAQKHYIAFERPRGFHQDMQLDENEKAHVYEFPGGDLDAPVDVIQSRHEERHEDEDYYCELINTVLRGPAFGAALNYNIEKVKRSLKKVKEG